MKKIICLSLFTISTFAQTTKPSVEKSLFSIEALTGIWVKNESRLTNEIALKTEIGLQGNFIYSSSAPQGEESLLFFIPEINVEPRWYYNMENRLKKGKSIAKNSANFVSLDNGIHLTSLSISNRKLINPTNFLTIAPKWGIRRVYGKHFTFETAVGIGYVVNINNVYNYKNGAYFDANLRLGYTF